MPELRELGFYEADHYVQLRLELQDDNGRVTTARVYKHFDSLGIEIQTSDDKYQIHHDTFLQADGTVRIYFSEQPEVQLERWASIVPVVRSAISYALAREPSWTFGQTSSDRPQWAPSLLHEVQLAWSALTKGQRRHIDFEQESTFDESPRVAQTEMRIRGVKVENGDLVGTATGWVPPNVDPVIFAVLDGKPISVAPLGRIDGGQEGFEFRLSMPMRVFYDRRAPALTLRIGQAIFGEQAREAPIPKQRYISSAKILDFDVVTSEARRQFGILLYTHTRTEAALTVLESLKRQGALPLVEVWMDGDQGNPAIKEKLDQAEMRISELGVDRIIRHRGNLGFRKLMLHSLMHAVIHYERFLALEDDCFPTHNAVQLFLADLDKYGDDPSVLTVYGHHFKVASERSRCSRFQGWGWASWSDKLRPFITELAYLYSIPETAYQDWVKKVITPDVVKRIDCTPPRRATDTLTKFFAWDETLCLLAALKSMWHVPTREMCVYNFGAGKGSTHFANVDWYRRPPYNMIDFKEVWNYYDASGNDT
jgi:hypothetical protein